MGEINYESLVAKLIEPLVTHPEEVKVVVEQLSDNEYKIKTYVNPSDLGRVIGKKGRVASAIRTIANAAAIRQKDLIEIEFESLENLNN